MGSGAIHGKAALIQINDGVTIGFVAGYFFFKFCTSLVVGFGMFERFFYSLPRAVLGRNEYMIGTHPIVWRVPIDNHQANPEYRLSKHPCPFLLPVFDDGDKG